MRICSALVKKATHFTGLALAAQLTAAPAFAAAQTERLTYNIMFGGLHVGDMMVVLDQSETGYRTEMRVKSRGVMERFIEARAELRGEGGFLPGVGFNAVPPTEALLPSRFETQWRDDEVISTRLVSFHPETRLAEATRELRHPETGRPVTEEELGWNDDDDDDEDDREVPAELRTKVLDPMGAFVAARRNVAMGGAREFRVPVFDGRRRYDVLGTVGDPRPYTIRDVERTLTPITTSLAPVFGFSERGIERMQDAEGRILLTTDGRYIPAQVMISNNFGTAVMNLTGDCHENPVLCDSFSAQQKASTE